MDVGVWDGHQVRLDAGEGPAVFTVDVDYRDAGGLTDAGLERLGLDADASGVRTEVDSQVFDLTNEEDARAEGGFVERIRGPGDPWLLALAPHGGLIERGTDVQATRLGAAPDVTAWYAAGWWPGGGAYRRWHVPSTQIHPDSFPYLGLLEHLEADLAVSFHGWTESHLAVGGMAPSEHREAVRDEIDAAVDGAFEVRLAAEDTELSGDVPENVVNWITASGTDGIQLEQPSEARTEYTEAVADAVGRALR